MKEWGTEKDRTCAPLREQQLWLLEQLCSIPSPSGYEAQAAAFLVDYLRSLGWNAWIDEVGNAVGQTGEGGPRILLLGHIDTVPGFIPVRIEGGRLYGRGAVDAKGPLAAFVCAVERLKERLGERWGARLPLTITLVGAVGEETASSPGAHHVARTHTADMVIVGEPSGWDSVTVGYKGCISFRATVRCACGHSAGPGSTAPERAVAFWQKVQQLCVQELGDCLNRESQAGQRTKPCVGAAGGKRGRFWLLEPRLKSIASSSDGLWEECSLEVSLRLPPGTDPERVKAGLLRSGALVDGDTVLEFSPALPGYLADKRSPLARAFVDCIRELGARPTFKLKCGTSDMNVVGPAWGVPVVAYGPGDSCLDHTPHEHLDLREYALAIQVLEGVLSHPLVTRQTAG